jgi:hypothetical protein
MKQGPFVVWKRDRYGTVFLWLDGPFQYPRWTPDFDRARKFAKPTAYRWAGLEDAEVVHALATPPQRLEEPAPQTDREPYFMGGAY